MKKTIRGMKVKNRGAYPLIFGFLVFAALASLFGIYVLSELESVSVEIVEASEIVGKALDFNVENFHTQLEVWEYAYEPTETRLVAFEKHNEALTDLLNDLLIIVERKKRSEQKNPDKRSSLAPQGEKQIKGIIIDLEKVRTDWVPILEGIKEIRTMKDLGYDKLEANGDNYLRYLETEQEVRKLVLTNEDLFDKLEFNQQVDLFIESQESNLDILNHKRKSIMSQFTILFAILITMMVVLGIGMSLFLVYKIQIQKR